MNMKRNGKHTHDIEEQGLLNHVMYKILLTCTIQKQAIPINYSSNNTQNPSIHNTSRTTFHSQKVLTLQELSNNTKLPNTCHKTKYK